MRNKARYTIGIASDLAVIGYNPENADMDRPGGEIIREVFHLRATDERGNRRVHGWFLSEAEALEAIRYAPPVTSAGWADTDPEYGSPAYVRDGGEFAQMDREARQLEDERWGFDTRYTRY